MNHLTFHELVKNELASFQLQNQDRFPGNELLKIDLHCHDHNSNVPDELLGRIMNVPETWLPTEHLIHRLRQHQVDAITITNHNNARSCFDQLEKGIDILVGAEFSCYVPDFETGIHVLTYGFSPSQETKLNKLRKNLYGFLEYAAAEDIPTIWAHPLYHYKSSGRPPLLFFDNMALLFERFEVLNGQRDTWQNLLVKRWVETLTQEKIDSLSKQTGIDPGLFCRNPYRKSISGGSDSHMGIFCGLTGTHLHVPDLEEKRLSLPLSALALQAIREGKMLPFGSHHNSEKMTITFLDYVCQIAINGNDPGLMRILLHKGTARDKVIAMLISNGFAELRRHKVTMSFINLFHNSFTGQYPHFTKRWFTPKVYKPVFDETRKMADSFHGNSEVMAAEFQKSIASIFRQLVGVLTDRLQQKILQLGSEHKMDNMSLVDLLDKFEFPSEIRAYIEADNRKTSRKSNIFNTPDIPKFLDGLSFSLLAASVILSAHFTSAHVLYKSSPLLDEFSDKLDYLKHPKRLLWLTDTYGDTNGVSMVLKSMLHQIQVRNLPIDILVCSDTEQEVDNLIVLKPVAEFNLPFYKQQSIRVPDFLELNRIFLEGEYDRIICSTEGPSGLAALYLKHAYTVPAYFYMHTDWITFGQKVLNMEKSMSDQFRRIIRAYYKEFDGVFVLNKDHHKWLTGRKMEMDDSSVFLTAHWADDYFSPQTVSKMDVFGIKESHPVILYTGRLSQEKGVMELPLLYKMMKNELPDLKIVVAGSGPAETELREALPEAIFMGWVSSELLPQLYSAADLLLLPSKFDTFSCVVLEAMSCGLPVIAYKTKGPKDIIMHGINGFLIRSIGSFALTAAEYLKDNNLHSSYRDAAVRRAKEYTADRIIRNLLIDVGLTEHSVNEDGKSFR